MSRSQSASYSPSGSNARSLTVTIACRNGRGLGFGDQPLAQAVLVEAVLRTTALELGEGGGEEPCLPREAAGASIDLGAGLEPRQGETLEGGHVLLVAAQRVVEVEHPGDERGAQAERRLVARPGCRSTGHAENDLTFDG